MISNKIKISGADDEIFVRLSSNAQELKDIIGSMVSSRKVLKESHRAELELYDREMLTFLWQCRPLLSTVVIARMIGLSRQRLYEKWTKFGFDTSDDAR